MGSVMSAWDEEDLVSESARPAPSATPADLSDVAALALQRAKERLAADRDVEVAAKLLEAAARAVEAAARLDAQGTRAHVVELMVERDRALSEREDARLEVRDLRERLAAAGPCRREPA